MPEYPVTPSDVAANLAFLGRELAALTDGLADLEKKCHFERPELFHRLLEPVAELFCGAADSENLLIEGGAVFIGQRGSTGAG